MMKNNDIDIIRNMKTIEWLKAELLTNVAYLHKLLVNNENKTKEDLEDLLSNIILESYILARRLGLDFEDVDSAMQENIKLNLIQEHKIERWYGDLSDFLDYKGSKKQR